MIKQSFIWVTLLLLVVAAVLQAAPLRESVLLNAAYLTLNHSLWADAQPAESRQRQMGRAAEMIHAAVGPPGALAPPVDAPCEMVKRVALAEQFRRQGRLDQAARWYLAASLATPAPPVQKRLALASESRVTPDGDLVLPLDMAGWYWRATLPDVEEQIDAQTGALFIAYPNQPGERDIVTYEWYGRLPIPYWHSLVLQVRLGEGTPLTVETLSGAAVRHLNYHVGTGVEETFRLPLEPGDELTRITISVSERNEQENLSQRYSAMVMPIRLAYDQRTDGCQPE
jgi:hypothetical protein